ncbi:MAG: protein translocase subunit SecF, partial [Gemmatimonadetes bacterium]|nr:protein translocase subunit SecF [Gemmatimonadota bacterium]
MDVVGKRLWFVGLSVAVILVGIAYLGARGLNLGIDFTSGTALVVEFAEDPGIEQVRSVLYGARYSEAEVSREAGGGYYVRVRDLGVDAQEVMRGVLEPVFGTFDVDFTIPETTTIGRSVAENAVQNAVWAVVVASMLVMLYIMYAFRAVPRSYRYAAAAIIALLHDVIIVLGAFAVLGDVISAEVNAIFIVGILTVIGYSVNDTIVVFDRIRENSIRAPDRALRTTVNLSVTETVGRSLATAITTVVVILAMLLFGGPTLRDFLLVLLIGIVVGTYSSIFVAAQVLVAW